MTTRSKSKNSDTTANLGFEAKLWATADALRNNMGAAEYKHVVLGLIFLKYKSRSRGPVVIGSACGDNTASGVRRSW